MTYYESKKLLNEYLLFHYGEEGEILAWDFGPKEALNFPSRVVSCLKQDLIATNARALDLGCAVGRASFELAKICEEVIGIDYSQSFIDAANVLLKEGFIEGEFLEEGDKFISTRFRAPDVDKERLKFIQGDAQNLDSGLGQFDLIVMANLIDRLPDPSSCLNSLIDFLKPNGQLLITSPYTWLEEFTPKNNWLAKEAESSLEGLQKILGPNFSLLTKENVPFLIREHRRKYQWSVAELSVWQKI